MLKVDVRSMSLLREEHVRFAAMVITVLGIADRRLTSNQCPG